MVLNKFCIQNSTKFICCILKQISQFSSNHIKYQILNTDQFQDCLSIFYKMPIPWSMTRIPELLLLSSLELYICSCRSSINREFPQGEGKQVSIYVVDNYFSKMSMISCVVSLRPSLLSHTFVAKTATSN